MSAGRQQGSSGAPAVCSCTSQQFSLASPIVPLAQALGASGACTHGSLPSPGSQQFALRLATHSHAPTHPPTHQHPTAQPPLLPPAAIFDIAAASVYIALKLQPWIAIIVFITLRWVYIVTLPFCCHYAMSWIAIAFVTKRDGHAQVGGQYFKVCARKRGRAGGECETDETAAPGTRPDTPLKRANLSPPPALPASCSGYIPMTIWLTEWRGKYRR